MDPVAIPLHGATLVAAPHLVDPNFFRAVVLVATHEDDGSLGLVLNRPTDIEVTDLLEAWAPVIVDPAVAFEGGPVQREVAVGVGRLRAGAHPPGHHAWTTIGERVGLLDLGTEDPETVVPDLEAVRVFSGYAGWGPGQLEAEVEAGDWFVVPFHPDDPFRPHTDDLWAGALRRQGGRLAMFAHYPAEPRWN
jgi:putative transcriptional regulator